MKPRLQTSLGQHLVLTPQLRQALHLLQLSAVELEAEIAAAIESNPLLDWAEDGEAAAPGEEAAAEAPADDRRDQDESGNEDWGDADESWYEHSLQGSSGGERDERDDPAMRVAQADTLRDHLLWQLNLGHASPRDLGIGMALVDAIDDDGYLRESFEAIAQALAPEIDAGHDEILSVLRRIQRFDPAGVGARDLGECLLLQLDLLPEDTPALALARRAAAGPIERLPKLGAPGLAEVLGCSVEDADLALQLLRSLDPRPGAQVGELPGDSYIVPDCVISRDKGVWRVALAGGHLPRLTIHRSYERMIRHASAGDAGYMRGCLQEARWLLKNLEARGETLLKVVRCLVRQQSGFLEFGERALRPLTLREVAAEIGMHESTVSRAVARKYVLTPRGTIALRDFFASGIDTEGGGASSVAIQQMIRGLIEAEDPRKPLSDASMAQSLKAAGIPVARRTVAKYREAMNIAASHERVRIV